MKHRITWKVHKDGQHRIRTSPEQCNRSVLCKVFEAGSSGCFQTSLRFFLRQGHVASCTGII